MTDAPPRLLHFRISHFNEKVRWALDHKRWPHVREALVPGFHVPRVRALTGQNQVPVLILDGRPTTDSPRILEEIERRRPDPPLFPERPEDRARALELQSFFDREVAPDLRSLFWDAYLTRPDAAARMATDGASGVTHALWRAGMPLLRPLFARNLGLGRDDLARARARLPQHLDRLAREVRPSGFLVGSSFGVADLCAAAILSAIVRPPEFPYLLPEPRPPAFVELREGIASHEAVDWVLRIYREHRGVSAEVPA